MICRLCLLEIESPKSINIFTVVRKDELISDMITNFAFIEISEKDSLSKVICALCYDRLKFVYQFKRLIIKSDTQLRRSVKSEDINAQDEEIQSFAAVHIKSEDAEDTSYDREEATRLVEDYKFDTWNREDYKDGENSKENELGMIAAGNVIEEKLKKVYKCDQCSSTFKSRYNLRVHKVVHTGTLPFKCDICDKGFVHNYMLIVHKRIHSDERPFKCDKCDKSFKSKSAQIIHRKIHQEIRAYECKVCGKSFAQQGGLQAHHNTHLKEKIVVCETCGKSFATKRGLYRHSKMHTGESTDHPCSICGKVYSSAEGLKLHLKTVHSEKRTRFPCEICEKLFSSKGVLKVHMRIHNGVKPYSCDICGKSFTQACVANLHKRVHTGETPFPCHSCTRQFSYKHHLKKHIEKEHPQ